MLLRLIALIALSFTALLPAQACHAAPVEAHSMAGHDMPAPADNDKLPMGGPGCLMCGTVAGDAVGLRAVAQARLLPTALPIAERSTALSGVAVDVAHPPPWRG